MHYLGMTAKQLELLALGCVAIATLATGVSMVQAMRNSKHAIAQADALEHAPVRGR